MFASSQHYPCINGVTEFTVWHNKLGHHENVDFQRLQGAVSSYQHGRIRLLRHAGLTLLVIAFLVGLFSKRVLILTSFFQERRGLVGKTLEHVASAGIPILIYRKYKEKCKCIILNTFIKI